MFQFPGFAFNDLYIQSKNTWFSTLYIAEQNREDCQVGFPIRKSSDQSLFAAPQGLSQRTTSFIASDRQGIHQTPFLRLIRSRRQTTHQVGRYLDRCLVCLPVHSSKPGY